MSLSRVVAITGCDTGLGWAIAARSAREGLVTVAGMYQGTDTKAAKALKDLYAHPCALDVTKPESVIGFRDYVQSLLRDHKDYKLHAIVNNAGVMVIGDYEWQTPGMIENTINVNLLGAMRVVSAFLPDLRKSALDFHRVYFRGGAIFIRSGSNDDILEKSRELFKYYRHTYSDLGIIYSNSCICSRKAPFGEVELMIKTTDGHRNYSIISISQASSKPRIINVASHCGLQPLPSFAPYSASKAGVLAWTRALRIELRPHGLCATAFVPGGFVASSHLLSNQAFHGAAMIENLNEEQKLKYEKRVKALTAYLQLGSQYASFDSLKDENIIETYMKALTDENPKKIYKVECLRYKFYYNLMKMPLPEVTYNWLVNKFVNFPATK